MEKSKKNRERAEAMDARYRKACLGYARIREIITVDKIEAGEMNPVVSRLDAWEYSRQNVNGVVDDPVSLQVLEDVVEISKQLSKDELTRSVNTTRVSRTSESTRMGCNQVLIAGSNICERAV